MMVPLVLALACGGGAQPGPTTTTVASKPDSAAAKDSAAKKSAAAPAAARIDTMAAAGMKPLVRETYRYVGDSRDPFRPVQQQMDLGPELVDLRLVAILYNQGDPSASIVTFRDLGNDHRYTMTPRQRFGRITIVSVDSNTVRLREDGVGSAQFQSYSLRRPEDQKP